MKKYIIITLVSVFGLIYTGAYAQDSFIIEGKIITKDGEPLIGADIKEENTNNITTTDIDGKFTLTLSGKDAVVEVSSIGFKSLRLPADFNFSEVIIEKDYKDRRGYINCGYSSSTLIPYNTGTFKELNSSITTVFSAGRDFYLNTKKPGIKKLKYGFAFDIFSMSYNCYSFNDKKMFKARDESYVDDIQIGMKIGPTVVFSPSRNWNYRIYAQYNPAYAGLLFDTDFDSSEFQGFSNSAVAGFTISYGFIGLGVEYKHTGVKYSKGDENMDYNYINNYGSEPDSGSLAESEALGILEGKTKFNSVSFF